MSSIDRYKNKDKRRKYLSEYNKKWRKTEQGRKYHREYMRRKRMGLIPGHTSENNIGRKWEKFALSLLTGSIDNNKTSFCNKYDILWNNYKIDVKTTEYTQTSWRFSTRKTPDIDYFLCICLSKGIIIKMLLIPSELGKRGIGIGYKSKYDKYELKIV